MVSGLLTRELFQDPAATERMLTRGEGHADTPPKEVRVEAAGLGNRDTVTVAETPSVFIAQH